MHEKAVQQEMLTSRSRVLNSVFERSAIYCRAVADADASKKKQTTRWGVKRIFTSVDTAAHSEKAEVVIATKRAAALTMSACVVVGFVFVVFGAVMKRKRMLQLQGIGETERLLGATYKGPRSASEVTYVTLEG